MNEEKSLVEIKNRKIWNRIITFFKNIFNNKKCDENIKNVENDKRTTIIDRKNFLADIDVKEDSRLLDIQKSIENGETSVSSLSDEEIKEINDLYIRQIKVLNDNYKRQIVELELLQKNLKKV